MKPALTEIKTVVDLLAQKIGAPQNVLPTYDYSDDGARPHIEVDNNGQLYYVVVERGQELGRDLAIDTDDILYKIFDSVTFSMACDFEARHRIKREDFRRQLFAKQEQLLGQLNKEWSLRKSSEHEIILRSHPFDDNTNY